MPAKNGREREREPGSEMTHALRLSSDRPLLRQPRITVALVEPKRNR